MHQCFLLYKVTHLTSLHQVHPFPLFQKSTAEIYASGFSSIHPIEDIEEEDSNRDTDQNLNGRPVMSASDRVRQSRGIRGIQGYNKTKKGPEDVVYTKYKIATEYKARKNKNSIRIYKISDTVDEKQRTRRYNILWTSDMHV